MPTNLWTRLFRREPEITRYTTNDYINWLTNNGRYGLTQPYGMGVSYSRGKPAERIENSFEGYTYGGFKANPIVFGTMTARSSVFSEARFMWRRIEDGRPGDLFSDDALDVLRRPWPNGTTGELLSRMIQDVDLAGNSYLVNEGNRLRRLRPDWVQIVLSGDPRTEQDVDVLGYVYTPGGPDSGDGRSFMPDEVCHWSPIPDPDALYRGMSWLTPVVREIQGDSAAVDHKIAFFRNGATLGPIVKVPAGMTAAQFKDFVEASNAAHQGVDNAYRPMYVGGGADVTLQAATMQQLDFKALQGASETRICVAARVPAVIAGVSEGLAGSSLNAGNYGTAKRSFADGCLRPLWRSACAALMAIIEVPADAELWYDERDIAFLRDDEQDIAQIQQTQASTVSSLITAGFKPESTVTAVTANDFGKLEHTGLTSVQLMPPGSQDANGDGVPDAEAQASTDYEAALDEFRSELEPVWEDIWRTDGLEDDEDFVERADYYNVRVDKGLKGGGRFRKLSDIVGDALNDWLNGDGEADDPLEPFSREQLRKASKDLGIEPRRGASAEELKLGLLKDARTRFRAEKGQDQPSHRLTLSSPPHRDQDVGVYQEKSGKVSLYRESSTGQRGARIVSVDSLEALQAWGEDNGEPQVSSWAASERGGTKPTAKKAPAAKVPDGDAGPLTESAAYTSVRVGYTRAGGLRPRPKGLTRTQVEDGETALMIYQGASSSDIQAHMRGPGSDRGFTGRTVASIQTVMDASGIDHDIVVFRGMRQPEKVFAAMGGRYGDGDLTGVTLTEKGFLSTSTRRRIGREFADQGTAGGGVLLEIRLPAGTGAVRLGGARENEVLAESGLHLTVVEDHGMVDGQRHLVVEASGGDAKAPTKSAPAPAKKAAKKAVPAPPSDVDTDLSTLRAMPTEARRDALDRLHVERELKPLLKAEKLPVSGRKRELVDRLVAKMDADAPPKVDAPDVEPPAAQPAEVETAIRQAYAAVLSRRTDSGNRWVGLADIRDELGGKYNRRDVDAALRRLEQADGVNIVPESNQKTLRPEDHQAAVVIGDQAKHAITIDEPAAATPDDLDDYVTFGLANLAREHGLDVPAVPSENDRADILAKLRAVGIHQYGEAEPESSLTPDEQAWLAGGDERERQQELKVLRDAAKGGRVGTLAPQTGRARQHNARLDMLRRKGLMKREGDSYVLTEAGRAFIAGQDFEPPAETAARTRQATVDRARSVSGLLRDVDEFLTNGASDKALQARIRSRSEVAGTPPELRDALLAAIGTPSAPVDAPTKIYPALDVPFIYGNAIATAGLDLGSDRAFSGRRPWDLARNGDSYLIEADTRLNRQPPREVADWLDGEARKADKHDDYEGAQDPHFLRDLAARLREPDVTAAWDALRERHRDRLAAISGRLNRDAPVEPDRTRLRQILDTAASDAGLRPIDAAGTRTTFDPARHEALDGRIPAGSPVRVTRQGYVTNVDGNEVVLDKAVVMADDGPTAPPSPAPRAGRSVAAFSGDYEARQAQLRADHGGEPTVTRLEGGISSDVQLLTYPDGYRVVRKDYSSGPNRRTPGVPRPTDHIPADAEELAAKVLDAFGLPTPAVVRVNDHTVDMEFVDGVQGGETGALKAPASVTSSEQGRLLGLADAVMGMRDRNGGGWMRTDGGIVPIDNGNAFEGSGPDRAAFGNPFAGYLMTRDAWKRDVDVDPVQLAEIRSRLEALRPEFERLGAESSHDAMLGRLDEIAQRAASRPGNAGPAAPATRPSGLPTDRKPESGDFDDLADRIGMLRPKTPETVLAVIQDLNASELARLARKFDGPAMLRPTLNMVSGRRQGMKFPDGLTLEQKREWLAAKLGVKTFTWRSVDPDPDDIERADDVADTSRSTIPDADDDVVVRAGPDPRDGHALEAYWTREEGLPRWAANPHPWTTLRDLLRKHPEIHDPEGLAAHYYHVVFHRWPGGHKNDKGGHKAGPG